MGDTAQNAPALASAPQPGALAGPQHGSNADGADRPGLPRGGGILASYLRTVLQAYVKRHARRAVTAAHSPTAADNNHRPAPTHTAQPHSPRRSATRPFHPVDRLNDFNSKWIWLKGVRKAARLGKGLGSKSGDSALLLQCEHWLEASDPKHRYGSHLRPYYTCWLEQHQAAQPPASSLGEDFFWWLDEGSGRAVDMAAEGVPRDKLEAGRVRYLTYEERERCEVVVGEDGLLRYKESNQLVHTYDVEETLDDLHMRHTPRPSLQGAAAGGVGTGLNHHPAADALPHPFPFAPHLPDAARTPIQLTTMTSTPALAGGVQQDAAQQPVQVRLRRTASAPGDGGPMDGGAVTELDGLPPAQWLVQQQQLALQQQQQPHQEQQQKSAGQMSPPQQQGQPAPGQQHEHQALAQAPGSLVDTAGRQAAAAVAPNTLAPVAAAAGCARDAAAPAQLDTTPLLGQGAARGVAAQLWALPGALAVLGGGGKKEKCGWIYVMDTSCRIYVHQKQRGAFHHSSFLSGAAVLAAGGLEVRQGRIEKLSAHSGHYRPDEATFTAFLEYLKQQGADLRLTRILGVSRSKPDSKNADSRPPAPVRTAVLMRRNSV